MGWIRSLALKTSGAVTSQALSLPYGGTRYFSGANFPTSYGYVGQNEDGNKGCSSNCTHVSRLTSQGGGGSICLALGCATKHPPAQFDTCTDTGDGYCAYGDDPSSLFSLISNDLGEQSPTWITAIGDKGLEWLIGAFKDIRSAGDTIFAGVKTPVDWASAIAGIAGAAVPAIALLAYSGELMIDQQQFDSVLDDVIGRLQGLDYAYTHGQAAWVQSARFIVQTHYSGCLACAPAGFQNASVSVQTWVLDPPASSA